MNHISFRMGLESGQAGKGLQRKARSEVAISVGGLEAESPVATWPCRQKK